MQDSLLIKYLGATPKLKVLDFFIENKVFDYSKSYVAKETKISRVTLDKIWSDLLSSEMVISSRIVGRSHLYKLNTKNTIVNQLMKLDFLLSKEYANKVCKEEKIIA